MSPADKPIRDCTDEELASEIVNRVLEWHDDHFLLRRPEGVFTDEQWARIARQADEAFSRSLQRLGLQSESTP